MQSTIKFNIHVCMCICACVCVRVLSVFMCVRKQASVVLKLLDVPKQMHATDINVLCVKFVLTLLRINNCCHGDTRMQPESGTYLIVGSGTWLIVVIEGGIYLHVGGVICCY